MRSQVFTRAAAVTLVTGASIALASAASASSTNVPAKASSTAAGDVSQATGGVATTRIGSAVARATGTVSPNLNQVTCDGGQAGFLFIVTGGEKRCYANAGTLLFPNWSPLTQLYAGNNAGNVLWQDSSGCWQTSFQKYQGLAWPASRNVQILRIQVS
jgi:hypothetical protein